MDAVEFIREWRRMCEFSKGCKKCPADKTPCVLNSGTGVEDAEKLVQIVEEWAKTHPRKTRQSEFLERWPEARVDEYGVLRTCPADLVKDRRDEYGGCSHPIEYCPSCRRKFWEQEVE